MVSETILLTATQSSLMGWMAWLTWRVLGEVRGAVKELKKLIVILTVPLNAMFEDAQKGLIVLTPEGQAAKSITQKRPDNLI